MSNEVLKLLVEIELSKHAEGSTRHDQLTKALESLSPAKIAAEEVSVESEEE